MRSLAYHSTKRDGLRNDLTAAMRDEIIGVMIERYSPIKWALPSDFLTYEHYLRVVREKVSWKSSPGYPYLLDTPTNEVMFGVVNGVPSEAALERVWVLVQDRIRDPTPDPIRLFIKPEPHKVKKLVDGAYRLISSVSVIDQIVDHMLFDQMNDLMTANFVDIPPKIGWSPVNGGWKIVPRNWLSMDKKHWDWGCQPWIFELLYTFRARMCTNRDSPHWPEWVRLAQGRYKALYGDPLFVTSLGVKLRQKQPGVQKSGCVNTLADNSIAQDLLHIRVCLETDQPITYQWTMGDDTYVEPLKKLKEYVELMQQFVHLKDVECDNSFAGFRFYPDRVEPMYKGKHAFNLLHFDPSNLEMIASYQLMYHQSTDPLFGEALKSVGTDDREEHLDLIWVGRD